MPVSMPLLFAEVARRNRQKGRQNGRYLPRGSRPIWRQLFHIYPPPAAVRNRRTVTGCPSHHGSSRLVHAVRRFLQCELVSRIIHRLGGEEAFEDGSGRHLQLPESVRQTRTIKCGSATGWRGRWVTAAHGLE